MAIQPGTDIGRYHILEQLDEGGMAVVYKAYDTRLETEVAIKVIRSEKFTIENTGRALKRFQIEARKMAQFNHPNIVKVIDFGEFEGSPYLVMPYLPGGTLKQKLGKPLAWQEAIKLLLPIADALKYAHFQGLIHRDIKPSNILITQSGQPMLSDFGVAKVLESEETLDLTTTGMGVGTPEYMAPEQASGKTFDHRVDIYALGVVLYEMLTSRVPFTADTPMAVIIKQATEPLPRPRTFSPNLPEEVERVLFKALAKEPKDRYLDMDAFANSLEKLTITAPKLPRNPAPAKQDQVKTEKKPFNPKWLICAAVLVGLGLVIIAGIKLLKGNSKETELTEMPDTFKVKMDYSLDLSRWGIDYYIPDSVTLDEISPNKNWIEPPLEGKKRLYGILYFYNQKNVGAIVDQKDEYESYLLFDINDTKDFLNSPKYHYSIDSETPRVEFDVNYSNGIVQPYAIFVYLYEMDSKIHLAFYRGSVRSGDILVGKKKFPVALEDNNTDGSYSDLDNTGIIIDLNNDGRIVESEKYWPNSPIKIGSAFYIISDINPEGSMLEMSKTQSGQIYGVIKDSITGAILSGVKLTLTPTGLLTETNLKGEFNFQAPEGNYSQIFAQKEGYVPLYVYDISYKRLYAHETFEVNIFMQPINGEKSGRIKLSDRDSYHFLDKSTWFVEGGDFYYSVEEGVAKFWANNRYQSGIIDLGDQGSTTLDQIDLPESGYYRFGVEAIVGHTYVSPAKEGEEGNYIVFKVLDIQPDKSVEIEYLYR